MLLGLPTPERATTARVTGFVPNQGPDNGAQALQPTVQ